jgi:hypothetical protein
MASFGMASGSGKGDKVRIGIIGLVDNRRREWM